MKKKRNTQEIIREIKSLVLGVDSVEKEGLRDELLAYLLFGDDKPAETGLLRGLSEKEKTLIRKLAEQTEALYKASRDTGEEDK